MVVGDIVRVNRVPFYASKGSRSVEVGDLLKVASLSNELFEFINDNGNSQLFPIDAVSVVAEGDIGIREVEAYEVKIWLGSVRSTTTKTVFDLFNLKSYLHRTVEDLSLSIYPTEYVSPGDFAESGFMILAINYPRFPKTKAWLLDRCIALAKGLLIDFDQEKISVADAGKIWMIYRADLISIPN